MEINNDNNIIRRGTCEAVVNQNRRHCSRGRNTLSDARGRNIFENYRYYADGGGARRRVFAALFQIRQHPPGTGTQQSTNRVRQVVKAHLMEFNNQP